ncbi:breast cancer anti-estrogen resistance protein 3 isoform X2 [Stegostoma tigrinum]|uniref:breast cancer anti-estrogen resistance protein 3 isoform X2 n=1 Tax=Stegostoma tigrinum TaxID=3053191 RepID=UPI00286FDCA2|nr:breast cancer anti-estrogen resistance protein 3 isoform X2 [Stegostoma tigrinum]
MTERCSVLRALSAALCCFYRSSYIEVKFSKERYIMDSTPEKLKKELEEELKLNSEDLRSHAWYHGQIPRKVAESLIQRDGDFLIRESLSSPGNQVLTCQWKNTPHHFKINRVVVRLNEGYSRLQYQFEQDSFDSIPALVRCYVGNRKPIFEQVGAIIFQPINRTVPLRCVEEKYGPAAPIRQQVSSTPDGKLDSEKHLISNVSNRPSQERILSAGNLLRNKDKSGSQPASLDYVQDRRQPLKSHQSESYLPLGMKPPIQQQQQLQLSHQPPQQQHKGMEGTACIKPKVFRTGSEPALSPTFARIPTLEFQAGEALRGSDSQLYPKPPPKPSKVPSLRMPRAPSLMNNSDRGKHSEVSAGSPERGNHYTELKHDASVEQAGTDQYFFQPDSFVERLKTEEAPKISFQRSNSVLSISEESPFRFIVSSVGDEEKTSDPVFVAPSFENISCFKPNDFKSKMLHPDNKPLETWVIRHVKELFANNDPSTIAKHILKVDCQVARILNISEEVKQQMGVSSGLELITLPHGHQLRLDLTERHNTLAIGIAVDVLGCTGYVQERAAVLNKIIEVALELKYSMGDLYGFSAIMKALDMPQITRLEETWTVLRRTHTESAIVYEKTLKPCIKALNEGREEIPLSKITVPYLMPLITLMEREFVTLEATELWENIDEGCEIMLKHLENARIFTYNAAVFEANAKRILAGFESDEELLETFQTEFAMRLLWGSRGAQVNQSERYEKFMMILTALSRKLEPPSPSRHGQH